MNGWAPLEYSQGDEKNSADSGFPFTFSNYSPVHLPFSL
jgi:hypothetical protein